MERISESNIDDAEKQTIHIASSTITALESALAAWEEAKAKPDDLKEKFERYSEFRDSLAEWLKKMLKANGSGDFKARQARLWEFSSICRKYKEDA